MCFARCLEHHWWRHFQLCGAELKMVRQDRRKRTPPGRSRPPALTTALKENRTSATAISVFAYRLRAWVISEISARSVGRLVLNASRLQLRRGAMGKAPTAAFFTTRK